MMWVSLHSCEQGPSYTMVKKMKRKTTPFSISGGEGVIFSLYPRQEEKVIWFPGERWQLGQQPLCWRGSEGSSCQVGQQQLHAILGCSHQAGGKRLNKQKGDTVLHTGPVCSYGRSAAGSELGIYVNAHRNCIHSSSVCVFLRKRVSVFHQLPKD